MGVIRDPFRRLLIVNAVLCLSLLVFLSWFAWQYQSYAWEDSAWPLLDAEAEVLEKVWQQGGDQGVIEYIRQNKTEIYVYFYPSAEGVVSNLKDLPEKLELDESGLIHFSVNKNQADVSYSAIPLTLFDQWSLEDDPDFQAENWEFDLEESLTLKEFFGDAVWPELSEEEMSSVIAKEELSEYSAERIEQWPEMLLAIDRRFVGSETRWISSVLWALCVLPVLAFLGVWWWLRQISFQLSRIYQAAESIGNDSGLSRRIVSEVDSGPVADTVAQLNQMLDRIERAVTTARDQANNIAHDLRTPLTAAYSQLQLLVQKYPELTSAEKQLARLQHVFGQLLRIHRLENNLEHAALTVVDLDDVLQEVVDLYEPVLHQKGQRFEFQRGRTQVIANEDLLFQSLCNLVDNASKFAPDKSVIELSSRLQGGGVDIGVGNFLDDKQHFSQSDCERWFEKFFRHDGSRHLPGNGLGLSFVQAATLVQNGEVRVRVNGGRIEILLHLSLAD